MGTVLKGYWGEEKESEWKGKSGCGKDKDGRGILRKRKG